MAKPTLLGLNDSGLTLSEQAVKHAKELPVNEGRVTASTDDFKTVDATIGVQRTWSNGFGIGAWVGAKFGAGKPQGSAGVDARFKWK